MEGIDSSAASGVIAVIPARYGSTRFPGKLLCPLHGKSILRRVVERVRSVRGLDGVLVATDDARLAEESRLGGAEAFLTRLEHPTGTDRIGEAVRLLRPRPSFLLNLQGDEPLFAPAAIERLVVAMRAQPDAIWTLAAPIEDAEEFARTSVVKVVTAADGRALYFSRAPVPHHRGTGPSAGRRLLAHRHVGVYGYPWELLEEFLRTPPGRLEEIEGLEQLRALEHGLSIRVMVGAWPDAGVDTPEDLQRLLEKYPTPEMIERAGLELDRPSDTNGLG